jgi:hypothetical protein
MFRELIQSDSDDIWNSRVGGFVGWQQFVHVLCGIHYWMRTSANIYQDPFHGLKIYSELENDPVDILSNDQISNFMNTVIIQSEDYFLCKNDKWLLEKSKVESKYVNLDIINMQIRHIQYHLGCFEGYMRDHNNKTQNWMD